jgi:hypothetical protein
MHTDRHGYGCEANARARRPLRPQAHARSARYFRASRLGPSATLRSAAMPVREPFRLPSGHRVLARRSCGAGKPTTTTTKMMSTDDQRMVTDTGIEEYRSVIIRPLSVFISIFRNVPSMRRRERGRMRTDGSPQATGRPSPDELGAQSAPSHEVMRVAHLLHGDPASSRPAKPHLCPSVSICGCLLGVFGVFGGESVLPRVPCSCTPCESVCIHGSVRLGVPRRTLGASAVNALAAATRLMI